MRLLLTCFQREPEPPSMPGAAISRLGWLVAVSQKPLWEKISRSQGCAAWQGGPVPTRVSIGTASEPVGSCCCRAHGALAVAQDASSFTWEQGNWLFRFWPSADRQMAPCSTAVRAWGGVLQISVGFTLCPSLLHPNIRQGEREMSCVASVRIPLGCSQAPTLHFQCC